MAGRRCGPQRWHRSTRPLQPSAGSAELREVCQGGQPGQACWVDDRPWQALAGAACRARGMLLPVGTGVRVPAQRRVCPRGLGPCAGAARRGCAARPGAAERSRRRMLSAGLRRPLPDNAVAPFRPVGPHRAQAGGRRWPRGRANELHIAAGGHDQLPVDGGGDVHSTAGDPQMLAAWRADPQPLQHREDSGQRLRCGRRAGRRILVQAAVLLP